MPPRKRASVALSPAKSTPSDDVDQKSMRFAAREMFGRVMKSHSPKKMGDPKTGIPLRGALPFQYLIGLDVLPLRQAMSLVGKPGSLKSQMGWWVVSQFLKYEAAPGIGVYLDVENKTNDNLVRGIVNDDILFEEMIMRVPVKTVQDLSLTMSEYATQYDQIVPDQAHPLVFMLDSMGALVSAEEVAALNKTGDVNSVSGYLSARRAAELTNHLKTWTLTKLQERPMMLVIINHLKEKMPGAGGGSNFGAPEKASPGGAHKDFLNVATIEMIREKGGSKLRTEARSKVWMQTLKASLADTGLKICVQMRTTGPDKVKHARDRIFPHMGETEEDYQRYHVDIDWDSSLVELLTRESGKVTIERSKLKDVCHISGSGNKLRCSRVGLKDVSPKELGHALHSDPEVVKDLQDLLSISRQPHFTGGPLV
jgi:hypothetical protein